MQGQGAVSCFTLHLNWESVQEVNIYELLAEKADVHLGQLCSHASFFFREAWWLVTAATPAVDVSVSFLTQQHVWPYTNFFSSYEKVSFRMPTLNFYFNLSSL